MVRCAFREFEAWHGMGAIMMLRECFLPCTLCMRHAFQGEPAMRAYWEIEQNRRNHSCVDIHTALNNQITSNAERDVSISISMSIYILSEVFFSIEKCGCFFPYPTIAVHVEMVFRMNKK